jgi:hypothetical protein
MTTPHAEEQLQNQLDVIAKYASLIESGNASSRYALRQSLSEIRLHADIAIDTLDELTGEDCAKERTEVCRELDRAAKAIQRIARAHERPMYYEWM